MTEPMGQRELSVIDKLATMYLNGDDAEVSTRTFINTCCIVDAAVASAGHDLYKAYQNWAGIMNAPTCTERSFLLVMGREGLPKTMRNGRRVWLGLRVKPDYVPEGSAAFVASVGRTEWANDIFAKVERWIDERCDTTTNADTWSDALYLDFTEWNNGERVGSSGFGTALGKYPNLYRHDRQPKTINGEVFYRTLWSGIKVVGHTVTKTPKPERVKEAWETADIEIPLKWRYTNLDTLTPEQRSQFDRKMHLIRLQMHAQGQLKSAQEAPNPVMAALAAAPPQELTRPAWMDLAPHQMTEEQRAIWRREVSKT